MNSLINYTYDKVYFEIKRYARPCKLSKEIDTLTCSVQGLFE